MTNKEKKLLKKIGNIADKLDVGVFVVGGFVRDQIIGRETSEIDFVVEGNGPEFAEKAKKYLKGHGFTVFKRFGTASFLYKDHKLEFVSARKESYNQDSRNPQVESASLEDDLKRRDFTVNTLAMDITKKSFGRILDPFHGKEDIKNKCIKTPLEPEQTFFDDPLRIMRAARFASQLQFIIDDKTIRAMKKEVGRIRIISQERITEEIMKILLSPEPSIGLRILKDIGLLKLIFPELDELSGVEQRDDYHHKDVFEHTMKVIDNLAEMTDKLNLLFCGLVHDVGKPYVKKFVQGKGWTFYGHDYVGMKMVNKLCRRLKLSNNFRGYAVKLTKLHMRPIHLIGNNVTDSAVRRLLAEAGANIDDLMTLCRADITSGNPKRVKKHLTNFDFVCERMREVEEKDKMRAFQSPVKGDEVMKICGLKPGPLVGKLKKEIEEAILSGNIPNEHDAALAYLLKIKDDYLGEN